MVWGFTSFIILNNGSTAYVEIETSVGLSEMTCSWAETRNGDSKDCAVLCDIGVPGKLECKHLAEYSSIQFKLQNAQALREGMTYYSNCQL